MFKMNLKEFDIFTFEKNTTLGFKRTGIFIRLTGADGKIGVGEISPLTERSSESFEEALHAIIEIRKKFLSKDLSINYYPPSVIFGLEMALSTLLTNDFTDIPFQMYSAKVKLKGLSFEKSIAICKEKLKNGIPLRIDMNESFELEDAIAFAKEFQAGEILYIEEPISNLNELETFYKETNTSYALDEKLLFHPIERLKNLKGLTHLVLKPTILGGEKGVKSIIEKTNHLKHVFSSAYETEIGLMHIVKLAAKLSPNELLGIDTAHIFHEKLTDFSPRENILRAKDLLEPRIEWSQFQKVTK
jgi:O-succinylbenzoate synthase